MYKYSLKCVLSKILLGVLLYEVRIQASLSPWVGAPGFYSVLTLRLGAAKRPGLVSGKAILLGVLEMETVW